jgi:branched-chain amino acid transport system substrate-binding protein
MAKQGGRMFKLATISAFLVSMLWSPANAEMNGVLRIGVLNDMSSVYADFQGQGSVVAAQIAAEDFAKISKRKVEILSADHQNKPDIGAAIARRWFDVDGVDMIIDVPNSAVALAVSDIARDKNKVFIGSGAGSAALTGAKCSPNTVHWTYDTWAMGHGLARGVAQQGGKTGFSSRRTTPSVKIWKSKLPMKLSQTVVKCLARSGILSARMIFLPSCCRPKPPARK